MLSEELDNEIEKWTSRLDKTLQKVTTADEHGDDLLENARAYRRDSDHFSQEGDLIKSFECLIWSWAFIEIGKRLGHLTVD